MKLERGGKVKDDDFKIKYGINDFYVIDDSTHGLDILGVCKK